MTAPAPLRVDIPKVRDPFVNTPLLPLGPDSKGVDQFWISTWNAVDGTTAVRIGTDGDYRLYHFTQPLYCGFYSCAPESQRSLWLCNWLDGVVHLDLDSGDYESYPTGAERALVFAGMVLDPPTGRLFALANVMGHGRAGGCVTAFTFDTHTRQTIQLHRDFARDVYMRASFPNGDGTWTLLLNIPGLSLLRWDPVADTLTVRRLRDHMPHAVHHDYSRILQDDRFRLYMPHEGWFDPAEQTLTPLSTPLHREASWLGIRDGNMIGVRANRHDLALIARDLQTGHERHLAVIDNATPHCVSLTSGNQAICVNVYGFMSLHDLDDGHLICSRRLPVDAVQHPDCLRRIDSRRLLGTPFITQRFWEIDLESGRGYDCGRAAPGWGEILQTWRIGGRIYMAEYGGGRLVEYDPAEHSHFPENPRIVAEPTHAMRPIAAADDGRVLWYACSSPYGTLGSTVARYDTQTGAAHHLVNPLPEHKICALWYDADRDLLVASTSISSDCDSAPPTADRACCALLDPATLEVVEQIPAAEGILHATLRGPLGNGRYLISFSGDAPFLNGGTSYASLSIAPLTVHDDHWPAPGDWLQLQFAGADGLFAIRLADRIELWDMNRHECLRLLHQGASKGMVVQERSLYIIRHHDILVDDHSLADI